MEAPKNLVNAVNRLTPRAVLILDTNPIMDNLRLDEYEINAPGPFLLVVPRIVVNELTSLRRGGKDEQTRRKASRACNVIDELYERGNPINGIHLGDDRWLITASSPRLPDSSILENEQVPRFLGKGDDALRRLAEVCTEGCPETSTLLITGDRDLRRVAKTQGLSACPLSILRSREALGGILDARPIVAPSIVLSELLNPHEERPVKIAMTLEELRSEGDNLVARGSGRVAYDERRYPFRWTFPYENLARNKNQWTSGLPESFWYAVMPLENVDFMGDDENIPEPVRRFVCSMLEDAHESMELQPPPTIVRYQISWNIEMGMMVGGWEGGGEEFLKPKISPENVERFHELFRQQLQLIESLRDGKAKSVGRVYRQAFQAIEELGDLLSEESEYDCYYWNLESALMNLLDFALCTWSVGETREAEYTYRPFSWPEEEEEAAVDDEGELGAS